MSDFQITEKETYFPVEFYGEFSDTGKKGFSRFIEELSSCAFRTRAFGFIQ